MSSDINPLGTIPLMIDGRTRMTESAAICQYLCALSAPTLLQVEPGEEGYGVYLNYLHFGEATLTFPQTLVLRYSRFEPEHRRQPTVADDYAKWFLARLRTLDTGDKPILFKCNMGAGHGGASGRYDALHEVAFDYAWVLDTLGLAGAKALP